MMLKLLLLSVVEYPMDDKAHTTTTTAHTIVQLSLEDKKNFYFFIPFLFLFPLYCFTSLSLASMVGYIKENWQKKYILCFQGFRSVFLTKIC